MSAADWKKLKTVAPERLKFKKSRKVKGRRVVEVTDERGRPLARLPARKGLSREVKARLRLAAGEARPRDVKKLKLTPGKGWKLESFDPERRERSFWVRRLFETSDGVPIGQAPGTTAHAWGHRFKAKSGHELWKAFAAIRPLGWGSVARKVPDWFRERGAWVGVRLTIQDGQGREHVVSLPPQWSLSGMTHPTQGRSILNEMLALGLIKAGRDYDYYGNTLVTAVDLVLTVTNQGAPWVPVEGPGPVGGQSVGGPQMIYPVTGGGGEATA